MKLFQFAVIWLPTKKQVKEEDKKPKLILDLQTILVENESQATLVAARKIPKEYEDQLNQVQVVVRPF